MNWLMLTIYLLTFVLVLDCLLLILLVLVQLPKKDAGMGQAFGAGTTDALFGAGSGNALTKMTKYATAIFFLLTLSLSILNAQQSKLKKSRFEEELQQAAKQMDLQTPTTATNAASATNNAPKPAAATNAALLLSTNSLAPKAPATPTAAPPTAPAPDKAK